MKFHVILKRTTYQPLFKPFKEKNFARSNFKSCEKHILSFKLLKKEIFYFENCVTLIEDMNLRHPYRFLIKVILC